MAEDEKQTTRLADAFKQDAVRQKAFKQAMLAASAAEKHQQLLTMARRHKEEQEAKATVSARKTSLVDQKEKSITQLKTLEQALLRANPELESLRPRGGADGASAWHRQQTLAGPYDGGMASQNADKVPLERETEAERDSIRIVPVVCQELPAELMGSAQLRRQGDGREESGSSPHQGAFTLLFVLAVAACVRPPLFSVCPVD